MNFQLAMIAPFRLIEFENKDMGRPRIRWHSLERG